MSEQISLKHPFFIALDLPNEADAVKFSQNYCNLVGGFKLGPKLILKSQWSVVKEISQLAPVFLDFKFYDIPSVTVEAVKNAFDLGASFVTVHAVVGRETLKMLSDLEEICRKQRFFKILCVTVLTSFTDENQPVHWHDSSILDKVEVLTQAVYESGLRGIVCSPQEFIILKKKFPDMYFVCPGVRFPSLKEEGPLASKDLSIAGEAVEDQKRIMSPEEILQHGVNAFVIGRPVYNHPEPQKVLSYLANLNGS